LITRGLITDVPPFFFLGEEGRTQRSPLNHQYNEVNPEKTEEEKSGKREMRMGSVILGLEVLRE